MSDVTVIEPEVKEPDPSVNPKDNLAHIMCCTDEDVAMCGGPLTGAMLDEPHPEKTCVVCEDLWRQPTFCPKGACTWETS